MKRIILLLILTAGVVGNSASAQKAASKAKATKKVAEAPKEDKSKRLSPPATVAVTTAAGNKITINYSQPAVKGRTIGKDIAPYGEIWRTGANEATTIELSKDARINKQILPAGKYSIYSIPGEKEWTLIFNKSWNQWGTEYDAAKDALRVTLEPQQNPEFTERLTFKINKEGRTVMMWGNTLLDFIID